LFAQFPNDATIELLRNAGVELLLVEYAEYEKMWADHYLFGDQPAPNPLLIKSGLENRKDVQLIACQDASCLYRLLAL
jgi:hypothetical protein